MLTLLVELKKKIESKPIIQEIYQQYQRRKTKLNIILIFYTWNKFNRFRKSKYQFRQAWNIFYELFYKGAYENLKLRNNFKQSIKFKAFLMKFLHLLVIFTKKREMWKLRMQNLDSMYVIGHRILVTMSACKL